VLRDLPAALGAVRRRSRGRERVARVCNLAWNIALFPSAAERERQVAATADLIARDAEGGAEIGPPPPGFREGFADELAMLAELKRDLFPWQPGLITRVDLKLAPGRDTVDVLSVETGEDVESVELVLNPSIMGLPRITKALVEMHQNTRAQRGTLERTQNTPGLLERAVTRDMLTAYYAEPDSPDGERDTWPASRRSRTPVRLRVSYAAAAACKRP